ncbi:hypothetical protein PLICRDRAFT_101453 [Plicaturopsis crispa FD-325 SS-3]|nr:hypothetical protein PLICRDRAFT_101453 [Plicaturopsis crispa FD-325 SS-3]
MRENRFWWTTATSNGFTTTFIPSTTSSSPVASATTTSSSPGSSQSTSSQISGLSTTSSASSSASDSAALSQSSSAIDTTTFATTSAFPVTVTQSSTTFTSTSQSVFTSSSTIFASPSNQANNIQAQPVCAGDGLDASADGLLATLILPSAIGILLWILFAILRPRFRQIYGLREWFVPQNLRPKPLGSGFFAFLFPHVPFIPSPPSDVSDAGKSPKEDSRLFPSDEELSQRILWISFLIVLGWTILGLAGALPLYMVSTPCLAHSAPSAQFTGVYSTLQDLSLLRLLQLLDNGDVTTIGSRLRTRASINGNNAASTARTRIIILTVFAIVLGLLPALWKVIKEFNSLVAYRRRWIDIRCEGKEMGFLSAKDAPGFVGWGEKRLKDFILKSGLSSSLEHGIGRNGSRNRLAGDRSRQRRQQEASQGPEEEANLEIDIQNLFSIGDTRELALLIDERDEILESLEIAETRYISSFRLSTPDPSIADFEPPHPSTEDNNRPVISRPLPLSGSSRNRRRHRALNPAYAASSLAPTSFVAPSQYYKLRGVQGVSGGRFADIEQPTLSDSINSRVVGSRFQEVDRNSVAYGRLPLGSHVRLEKTGELGPTPSSSSNMPSSPGRFGPNHGEEPSTSTNDGEYDMRYRGQPGDEEFAEEEDDWVDVMREAPIIFGDEHDLTPPGTTTPSATSYDFSSFQRRPQAVRNVSTDRRETFPLRPRNEANTQGGDVLVPPHLRLQPQQPFVRPISGLDHNDLGSVYNDISQWRTRLKQINMDIADAQRACYNDIADGARIQGWIMIGRGLRFLPRIQLIEGRAKEDIRWDVLQNPRSAGDSVALWAVIALAAVFLGATLTAVAGLALGGAPDVAHFITFLQPLASHNTLVSGLATALAPAVATSLFVVGTLAVVDWAVNVRGSISISAGQLLVFKTTFFILTIIAAIWLITVGALIFSLQAFSSGSGETSTVANGSIYISALALVIVVNVAIIYPALLMLQPFRLRRVLKAEKNAVTPRQRFRAVYPRTYNPTFATGACVLAIVFASIFSLIFPLIGPPVVVLLFLTLIAHRYLVGYVYGRTHSQTGGLLQIWLLQRFGTLLALQPLLLGLIFLSRRLWIEGGILAGVAFAVVVFVEGYCNHKTSLPGRRSLSHVTQDSLMTFTEAACPETRSFIDEERTSLVTSSQGPSGRVRRGSMASVLEMMSLTLAVMPSPSQVRGPVPLRTETLDDLTATERAARTHPDAPPHLPSLSFSDHAEEMAGILYAPELIAPPPIIWLPNDSAGVARSEAYDLQKYHDLQVTLDVRAKEDVLPRRSSSSRGGQRA